MIQGVLFTKNPAKNREKGGQVVTTISILSRLLISIGSQETLLSGKER